MERCRRRIKETEERAFSKKGVMQSADALFTFVYLFMRTRKNPFSSLGSVLKLVCVGVRTHTMCMLEAVFVE